MARTQPNAGSYSTHTRGGGRPGERIRPGAPWPTPVRGSGEPFAPGTARGLRVSDSPASSRCRADPPPSPPPPLPPAGLRGGRPGPYSLGGESDSASEAASSAATSAAASTVASAAASVAAASAGRAARGGGVGARPAGEGVRLSRLSEMWSTKGESGRKGGGLTLRRVAADGGWAAAAAEAEAEAEEAAEAGVSVACLLAECRR